MIGDIMQPTHLLFVFVIALLVLGPKRLPEVGRQLGNGIRDFRAAISGEHSEDEDESAADDGVLAPVAAEPIAQQPAAAASTDDHLLDETITQRDTPAEHQLADSAVEQSALSSDHRLGDETAENLATSAEHEFAHGAVEQPPVAADHELPTEAAEPPTAPIEPAVAHTPADSAAANGAAAPTNGDHSFAEPPAPAKSSSDRVA